MFFGDGALRLARVVGAGSETVNGGFEFCRDQGAVRILVAGDHQPALRLQTTYVLGDCSVAEYVGVACVVIVGFAPRGRGDRLRFFRSCLSSLRNCMLRVGSLLFASKYKFI